MEERVIRETEFPSLKLFSRGKVRDTWELRNGKLLMIATDRISAFDVVVGAIPGKGKILTGMSEFWFKMMRDIVDHHMISSDLSKAYDHQVWVYVTHNDLIGRSMIVKRAENVIPIGCVVRGYLAGSGWQEYQKTGSVCGIPLPSGLKEGDKLPDPIFTPATKAEAGTHDENITFEQMVVVLNSWLWKNEGIRYFALTLADKLELISREIYEKARDYAAEKGIIIADTKLEFGILNNKLILIDELLTPDSSRFWPADEWQPGKAQKSFDKQFLRDWLINEAKWNKQPPVPELPTEVIKVTQQKYQEALDRLVS